MADQALAVRLAEASCGSKWMHCHPTKMAAMQAEPAFAALGLEKSAAKLGLTATLDSHALVAAIKEKHVCDKKAAETGGCRAYCRDVAAPQLRCLL